MLAPIDKEISSDINRQNTMRGILGGIIINNSMIQYQNIILAKIPSIYKRRSNNFDPGILRRISKSMDIQKIIFMNSNEKGILEEKNILGE